MSRRTLRPHPAREQILDVMRRHGAPISPVQLARVTGASLGSTAYHVRALAAAGVIEPAGEQRGIRGSTEHFYAMVVEDPASSEVLRQMLGLCGALTVRHADGDGLPVATELDDDGCADLEVLLDGLRPQVQQIAAVSTARVRRQRG
jgi:DNA-binding transcriptional ArsR family regulator